PARFCQLRPSVPGVLSAQGSSSVASIQRRVFFRGASSGRFRLERQSRGKFFATGKWVENWAPSKNTPSSQRGGSRCSSKIGIGSPYRRYVPAEGGIRPAVIIRKSLLPVPWSPASTQ